MGPLSNGLGAEDKVGCFQEKALCVLGGQDTTYPGIPEVGQPVTVHRAMEIIPSGDAGLMVLNLPHRAPRTLSSGRSSFPCPLMEVADSSPTAQSLPPHLLSYH